MRSGRESLNKHEKSEKAFILSFPLFLCLIFSEICVSSDISSQKSP